MCTQASEQSKGLISVPYLQYRPCPQWTPGQKLDPTMTKAGKVHTLLTLFCSLDVRLSVYAFGNCLHAFSS